MKRLFQDLHYFFYPKLSSVSPTLFALSAIVQGKMKAFLPFLVLLAAVVSPAAFAECPCGYRGK